MNKEQVKGRFEEAKGKVKEVAGRVLDDEGMELQGNIDKNADKLRAGVGNAKENAKKHG